MTRKTKRFVIKPDMAAALRNTLEAGGGDETGTYHVFAPLERIRIDEDNLRRLEVRPEHLRDDLDSLRPPDLALSAYLADLSPLQALRPQVAPTERMAAEVADLLGLAVSIAQAGVVQAVRAYAHGDHYRLIAGERRYLASILAARKVLPALVYSEVPSPQEIRRLQYIENKQRRGLTVRDDVYGQVLLVQDIHDQHGGQLPTVRELAGLLGISRSSAQRAIRYFRMPEDVREAVEGERLRSLNVIDRIAAEQDPQRRARLIAAADRAGSEREALQAIEAAEAEPKADRQPVTTRVETARLGNVRTETAARLLRVLLAQEEFAFLRRHLGKSDQLADRETVEKVWRRLIQTLEGNGDG